MRFFVAVCASAIMIAPAMARETYVAAYGGANWDDVARAPFVSDNAGVVVGAALGTSIPSVPGLYVEADVSFRQNEVDLFGGVLSADHDTLAILANARYSADIGLAPIRPYALIGVGYGRTEATFENITIANLSSAGFAWQIGGGFEAPIADGMNVGIGYRFLQAPTIDVLGHELSDGRNHAVTAELRFAL